jgi:acetyl esterase
MFYRTLVLVLLLVSNASVVAQETKQRFDSKDLPAADRKITYKEVNGKTFQLHVFEPSSSSPANESRAAILFFFGGGWNNGDPKQFYSQCRALADLGMVAMSAEYRVASRDNAKVIDCIADAQDAIAYVRSHAAELKIDPKRIAAGGGSAGGHLAASTATLNYRGSRSDTSMPSYRPDALVLFNPALALAPTGSPRDKDMERISNMSERVGDKPETASPFHHLKQDLPPTIIFHGIADSTVPYWTVELFRDKANELGGNCKVMGYKGEGHGFFNLGRAKYQETRDAMIQFLRDLKFVP